MFKIHPKIRNFYKKYFLGFECVNNEDCCFIEEKPVNGMISLECEYDASCIAFKDKNERVSYCFPPGSNTIWSEQEMIKLIKLKIFL